MKLLTNTRPVLKLVPKHQPLAVYREMTDAELIVACQHNDEQALAQLLTRHRRTIANMLYRVAPDWKDTSDLIQEAYIRIWRSIDQLKNPLSFISWLNQIVTNLYFDELRKRPRHFVVVSIDEPLKDDSGSEKSTRDLVDASQQPDTNALGKELSLVLTSAISNIPEHYRTAVFLRDVEGLSYEEISQLTATELGTVKSRICRARTKIRKQVVPYLRNCA